MPPEHLEPCHTCNARGRKLKIFKNFKKKFKKLLGRKCSKQDEGGPGVSGVDFVLYVSSSTTSQVPK